MRSSYSGSVMGPKRSTWTLPRMFMPAPWITRILGMCSSVLGDRDLFRYPLASLELRVKAVADGIAKHVESDYSSQQKTAAYPEQRAPSGKSFPCSRLTLFPLSSPASREDRFVQLFLAVGNNPT